MTKILRPATIITDLEMRENPQIPAPILPIEEFSPPPVERFLSLYKAVGENYYWGDFLALSPLQQAQYCQDEQKSLFVLSSQGADKGFFLLAQKGSIVDLAYFGLLPEAIGQNWGKKLLDYAISAAWARNHVKKLTVNTCSLDHERALPLYLSRGFSIIGTREISAIIEDNHA